MNLTTILLIAVVGLILYLVGIFNVLQKMRVMIKEAWSQIDVQLKRRVDLIPNLVDTVKGYAAHEKRVFEEVTTTRSSLMNAKTPAQAEEADNALRGALKSLFAVAEAYPDLKAQQNFLDLQGQLSDTEDKIAYSRQYYNATVRDFNAKIVVFPTNMIAGMLGFKQEEFFQAAQSEKEPVKVGF